jgi:hypothetical protein
MVALRPQTPKPIRGGWSYYADTSKPVVGYGNTLCYGAQNMVTVQFGFRTSKLSIPVPTLYPNAPTGPTREEERCWRKAMHNIDSEGKGLEGRGTEWDEGELETSDFCRAESQPGILGETLKGSQSQPGLSSVPWRGGGHKCPRR